MEPRGGRNDSTCFRFLSDSLGRMFVFGDRTGQVYPPNTVFTGVLLTQFIPVDIVFNESEVQTTNSPPTTAPCPTPTNLTPFSTRPSPAPPSSLPAITPSPRTPANFTPTSETPSDSPKIRNAFSEINKTVST